MVRDTGLEPARVISPSGPKPDAYTNSANPAYKKNFLTLG